jgi:hypothetical protein
MMRVIKFKDIVYVLELHLETSEAAGIVLDLLDYQFDINDDSFNNFEEKLGRGYKECEYSWWNGESYECSLPSCKF